MPPKRKRAATIADETQDSSTTRATRSSARSTTKVPATKDKPTKVAPPSKAAKGSKGKREVVDVVSDLEEEEAASNEPQEISAPPTKKTKKTTTTKPAPKPKATKPKKSSASNVDDENIANDDESGPSKAVPPKKQQPVKKAASIEVNNAPVVVSQEPYNPSRIQILYNTYADPDDKSNIGPEQFGQLCTDAGMDMGGAQPLILAWILDAKEMGKFSKEEWKNGLERWQISSLSTLFRAVTDVENLLIKGVSSKAPSINSQKKDSYNPAELQKYIADPKAAFLKLYMFCFALAKPEEARNIEMETAVAFWTVLVAPKYIIMSSIVEFINEKATLKGVNKDLWSMTLEFCQTVEPNLENYEADGAWPTLLDDFATWKKAKEDV